MKQFVGPFLILVVFVLAVAVYFFVRVPASSDLIPLPLEEEAVVTIGEARIIAEKASTPEAQARGLSGRKALGRDRGMLFVFPVAGMHRFTMRGMQFPLDFIWIREGRVVGITENVAPGVASIEPPASVDMVLEMNAGVVAERGSKVGDAVAVEK